jgi:acetyl esterase/lipase
MPKKSPNCVRRFEIWDLLLATFWRIIILKQNSSSKRKTTFLVPPPTINNRVGNSTEKEEMSYELEVFRYGEDEDQFFRLMTPILPPHSPPLAHGRPIAVWIHGGYWKQQYHIDNALLDQVAPSLCDLGYAVMILEYRRGREALDGGRGGWPNTNLDIALSLQKLETLATSSSHAEVLNLKKVVLIGHSAGGTLALWPCCTQTAV